MILFLTLALALSAAAGEMPAFVRHITAPAILADAAAVEDTSFRVWCIIGAGLVGIVAVIVAWRYLTGQSTAEERTVSGGPVLVRKYREHASAEDLQRLDTDVHNEISEMRAYVQKMTHDIGDQLQKIVTTGEEREERLLTRLTEIARERSVSVARLHDKVEETHDAHRRELDAKIAQVREETSGRLAEIREDTSAQLREIRTNIESLPEKLISILRNTGAIGRRGNP